MGLEEYRTKLDDINEKLSNLYQDRLDVVKEIGKYKKKNNIAIYDRKREDEIIYKMTENVSDEKKEYIDRYFRFIMDESKKYQE